MLYNMLASTMALPCLSLSWLSSHSEGILEFCTGVGSAAYANKHAQVPTSSIRDVTAPCWKGWQLLGSVSATYSTHIITLKLGSRQLPAAGIHITASTAAKQAPVIYHWMIHW